MKKILLVLGGLLLLVLLLPVLIKPAHAPTASRTPEVVTTGESLLRAIEAYREQFGEYPAGEVAEILRALRGENPGEVVLLFPMPKGLTAAGVLLDPWKTPFRIQLPPEVEEPRVQSAGPNQKFEPYSKKSDDYYSWIKGTGRPSGGIPGLPF